MNVMYIGIATFVIIAIIMGVVLSLQGGSKKTVAPPAPAPISPDVQTSSIKNEAINAIFEDSVENFEFELNPTYQVPQSMYNQMVSKKVIRLANVINTIRQQLVGPDVSYLCYQTPSNLVELYINGVRIFLRGLDMHRNELSSPAYMPLFGALGMIIFYLNKKINLFILPPNDPGRDAARSMSRIISNVNKDASGNVDSVFLNPSVYRMIFELVNRLDMSAAGPFPPYIYSFFIYAKPILQGYYPNGAVDYTKPVDINVLGILFICYFIYDAYVRSVDMYVSFDTALFGPLAMPCPVVTVK
jgi:hypothetical protein